MVHLPLPLGVPGPIPVTTHASYTRDEVLAAFGESTVTKPRSHREGVLWSELANTDLLFVTLQKTEKDYSPTTRYRDYAISDELFHWESQSRVRATSPTGQRYIHRAGRGSHGVLFIRSTKRLPERTAAPFFCAGTARYVEHRSERPMQIVWKLDNPLPGDLFTKYRAAVA